MATKVTPKSLPAPNNLSDSTLVFGVCLSLLAIIVIFMAIRIPRLLALFGTKSEWIDGFILRHVSAHLTQRAGRLKRHRYPYAASLEKEKSFDDSMNDIIYLYSLPSSSSEIPRDRFRGVRKRYPPHIPSCIKAFRPLLKPFRARISTGFSFGQLLILVAYLSILSYAILYKSNIFVDQSRTGWLAVSQLPFVYAFAQKNNVIGAFLGFGYEKLNFIHRFAGKLVILTANIHGLHFLYLWSLNGQLWQKISVFNAQPMWGIATLFCIDSLYFFSTPYIRDKAYNLFFRTHVVAVLLLLPATYMHKRATLPYIFTCAALYVFDWFFRLVRTCFVTAYIQPLPEFDVTRVEIPYLNAGWRAGQHVRLRVLSFRMGWFGWAETHPFTIARAGRSGSDGMVLLCKRTGDWTQKLYDMAQAGTKQGRGGSINVVVEGPYGGPGHTIYASFSAAVLIAGGSGISYSLSILEDLVLKDLKYQSRVKSIDLVWSIPNPASLAPFLPTLASLVRQSIYTPVQISVYYTGAPTGKEPPVIAQALLSNIGTSATPKGGYRVPIPTVDSLPPGVTITAGRPNFPKIFNAAIKTAVSLGYGAKDDERVTGMIVGVCGPVKMADDVSKAVSSIDPMRRDQVGGVEICEEVFGW